MLFRSPSAVREFPSATALNRRKPVDWRNVKYGRVEVGGGTDGATTSYAGLQFTADLTGATGWTDLHEGTKPKVSTANLGGTDYEYSPIVEIAEAARARVLTRMVTLGGNDSASPTISHFAFEGFAEVEFEGNSLAGVIAGDPDHPIAGAAFGGSQNAGGGVLAPGAGNFGTLAPALQVIPTGMTVVRNGSPLASFGANEHGIEAGVAAELDAEGLANGAQMVVRYEDATNAQYWVDTGLDQLKADADAAGVTVRFGFYTGAVSDHASAATVAAQDESLVELRAKWFTLFGDAALIVMECTSTDAGTVPFLAEGVDVQQDRFAEPYRGTTRHLVKSAGPMQTDGVHPTSELTLAMGGDFIRAVIDDVL